MQFFVFVAFGVSSFFFFFCNDFEHIHVHYTLYSTSTGEKLSRGRYEVTSSNKLHLNPIDILCSCRATRVRDIRSLVKYKTHTHTHTHMHARTHTHTCTKHMCFEKVTFVHCCGSKFVSVARIS